ncbi:MAG: 3'-5' exonuclease [Leptospirales bacterium]
MKITFLDVETTGLLRDPEARIIEIAFSTWENGKSVRKVSSLVRGADTVSKEITRINGISSEMLKDTPSFEEIWKEYREFFVDSILVAHNLAFDVGMLNRELLLAGRIPLGNRGIDTVPLARKMLQGLPNYRLGELCRHMGILNENPHRALGDLEALEKILSILLETPPSSFDAGVLGIFCLWGSYPSHRYFRDVAMFAFNNQKRLDLFFAPREGLRDMEPISVKPVRIASMGLVAESGECAEEYPFDSLIEIGVTHHEPGSLFA